MRAATADERRHMGRVAALGCCVCTRLGLGATPAEVHHLRSGAGAMRASHFDTIPLCFLHHRGQDGIHTLGTKAWQRRFGEEHAYLAKVIVRLSLSAA